MSRKRGRVRRRFDGHQVSIVGMGSYADTSVSGREGECFYCQRHCYNLTVDHVLPRWTGASRDNASNQVDACSLCNKIKADGVIPDEIRSSRREMTRLFRSGEIKRHLIRPGEQR